MARQLRYLILLGFMFGSLATLHAWQYPDALCQGYDCDTCSYEQQVPCTEWAGYIYTEYHLSGCDDNGHMCSDNESTCLNWCFSLWPALDACRGTSSGCHVTYPGNSACDELLGTMDCSCGWYNSCPE